MIYYRYRALLVRWTVFLTVVHAVVLVTLWWFLWEAVMPVGLTVGTPVLNEPLSRWWDIAIFPLAALTCYLGVQIIDLVDKHAEVDQVLAGKFLEGKPKKKDIFSVLAAIDWIVFIVSLVVIFSGIVGGILGGIHASMSFDAFVIVTLITWAVFDVCVRRLFIFSLFQYENEFFNFYFINIYF